MNKKYVDVSKEQGHDAYAVVPVEQFIGMESADERLATFAFIQKVIGRIAGRSLTIVDASFTDKEQRKAVKDLFKGVISDEYEFISGFMFDQEMMDKVATESFEEAEKRGEVIEAVDLVDMLLEQE